MAFLCLYSPEKHNRFYKTQAYIFYCVFIILVPLLAILYLLLEEEIDIVEINYNAAFLSQTTCFITKLLPFVTNIDQIRKCIHYFGDPNFKAHNDGEKKIIDDCVRICRRNSTAFLIGVTGGVFIWDIKPLFGKDYALPIEVWLPFNPKGELKTYYCVYLFLALAVVYVALAGTMVDPLIGGLACHAAGQLKILKNNLQHLDNYTEEERLSRNKNTKNRIIYYKIKQCIDRHNAILNFAKEFEECFSWVVFSQFAASSFAICFCILQLSANELTSINAVSSLLCVFIVLGEIYFYCYYGTMLLEENNSLTNAIYMGNWYEYNAKSRKSLITLMERSKRPMIITAGKLLDLSLETFTM
ncbi:7tm 6 domain containing protein, partial [Asbolus verrucosus]